jgi:hypothetical protein
MKQSANAFYYLNYGITVNVLPQIGKGHNMTRFKTIKTTLELALLASSRATKKIEVTMEDNQYPMLTPKWRGLTSLPRFLYWTKNYCSETWTEKVIIKETTDCFFVYNQMSEMIHWNHLCENRENDFLNKINKNKRIDLVAILGEYTPLDQYLTI